MPGVPGIGDKPSQPQEPNWQWVVFDVYRLLGPARRSLRLALEDAHAKHGVKRKYGKASDTWREVARRWRWQERAEAWDKHLRKLAEGELEGERKKWAEARRIAYQAAFLKLAERLKTVLPSQISPKDAVMGLAKIGEQLRIELDDQPEDRDRMRTQSVGVQAMPRSEDRLK